MSFQYAFVYFVVNVVCFLSALVIMGRLNSSIGSDTENKIFRRMLLSYMAFLLCEVIWALGYGNIVPMSPFVIGLVKVLSTVFIPIMVYFWFHYAETRFGNPLAHTRKFKWLTAIPLIIMLLIYATSVWTGAVAKVNAEGAVEFGPAIGITGLVDNIYGIAVVVHAVIIMRKDEEGYKRKDCIAQILFIAICTLGGITDAIVSDTPVMPLAIMLSFNVLFIHLQESKIFNDALTGLNNRRLADRYIAGAIQETNQDNPLYLYMLDVDNFKTINDQYGHLDGDKALAAVAEGLRKVMSGYHGFVGRWGGDEFVVALHSIDEAGAKGFRDALNAELDVIKARLSLPFDVALSMGMASCTDRSCALSDLVEKADEMLYQDKNLRKAGR